MLSKSTNKQRHFSHHSTYHQTSTTTLYNHAFIYPTHLFNMIKSSTSWVSLPTIIEMGDSDWQSCQDQQTQTTIHQITTIDSPLHSHCHLNQHNITQPNQLQLFELSLKDNCEASLSYLIIFQMVEWLQIQSILSCFQ